MIYVFSLLTSHMSRLMIGCEETRNNVIKTSKYVTGTEVRWSLTYNITPNKWTKCIWCSNYRKSSFIGFHCKQEKFNQHVVQAKTDEIWFSFTKKKKKIPPSQSKLNDRFTATNFYWEHFEFMKMVFFVSSVLRMLQQRDCAKREP